MAMPPGSMQELFWCRQAMIASEDETLPAEVRGRALAEVDARVERDLEKVQLWQDYNVMWRPNVNELTCPRCGDEEGVSSEQKAKKYTSPTELRTHLDTACPSPVTKWLREHGRDEDGEFECPYCKQLGIANMPKYPSLEALVRHIHTSSVKATGKKHNKLKIADGWYKEKFIKSFLPLLDGFNELRRRAPGLCKSLGV